MHCICLYIQMDQTVLNRQLSGEWTFDLCAWNINVASMLNSVAYSAVCFQNSLRYMLFILHTKKHLPVFSAHITVSKNQKRGTHRILHWLKPGICTKRRKRSLEPPTWAIVRSKGYSINCSYVLIATINDELCSIRNIEASLICLRDKYGAPFCDKNIVHMIDSNIP